MRIDESVEVLLGDLGNGKGRRKSKRKGGFMKTDVSTKIDTTIVKGQASITFTGGKISYEDIGCRSGG